MLIDYLEDCPRLVDPHFGRVDAVVSWMKKLAWLGEYARARKDCTVEVNDMDHQV